MRKLGLAMVAGLLLAGLCGTGCPLEGAQADPGLVQLTVADLINLFNAALDRAGELVASIQIPTPQP